MVSASLDSLDWTKKLFSFLNYSGQQIGTIKYYKNYKYTHAILVLSDGLYIESTIEQGVSVFSFTELLSKFKTQYNSEFKVIRYSKLNDDIEKKIFKRAEYYYEQKYNISIMAKQQKLHSSYCSELIMNIYKDTNIEIKKGLYATWPIHLFELLGKDAWLDVTHEYKILFDTFSKKNLDNTVDTIDDSFYTYIINSYLELGDTTTLMFIIHHRQNNSIRMINNFINNYDKVPEFFYDKTQLFKDSSDALIINENQQETSEYKFFQEELYNQFQCIKFIDAHINNYIIEELSSIKLNGSLPNVSWKDQNIDKEIVQAKVDSKKESIIIFLNYIRQSNDDYENIQNVINYFDNEKSHIKKKAMQEYLSSFSILYFTNLQSESDIKNVIDTIEELRIASSYNEQDAKNIKEIKSLYQDALNSTYDIYFNYLNVKTRIESILSYDIA